PHNEQPQAQNCPIANNVPPPPLDFTQHLTQITATLDQITRRLDVLEGHFPPVPYRPPHRRIHPRM
ncbi:Hypothetical predicted protein, partial [Olea europaea subsp. europaea]